MLTEMINFADAFMEAVNIMETAWSEDEDCKQIFASMEAAEIEQVVDNSGGSPRKFRRRQETQGEGKSMKDVCSMQRRSRSMDQTITMHVQMKTPPPPRKDGSVSNKPPASA